MAFLLRKRVRPFMIRGPPAPEGDSAPRLYRFSCSPMKPLPLSDSYRSPIRDAIVGQVLLTVVMLLLLDGGFTAKVGAYAMAGFGRAWR
jgi:hypothetical protein